MNSDRSSNTGVQHLAGIQRGAGILLALVMLICGSTFGAELRQGEKPVPAKPQNGVYGFANGYASMVLELKDGRFRCWLETDAQPINPPTFPISGEYTVEGDTISLKHEWLREKQWSFRTFNGTLSLWRPGAVEAYARTGHLDRFGILRVTDKSAEEAWNNRVQTFMRK